LRDRIHRPQWVTVRPLNPDDGDVFGDAPVVAPDDRDGSFRMKMQISWNVRTVGEFGSPGRTDDMSATALVRKRDIPPTVTWVPGSDDLIELVGGDKLFVAKAEPAMPRRVSIRRPDGGWDGWRLALVDRQPVRQGAIEYE
jgi:hypothetical protein